jgi:hypothetical protein
MISCWEKLRKKNVGILIATINRVKYLGKHAD